MNPEQDPENRAKNVHLCEGYVRAEPLQLDHSTIERARKAGIGELLLKLSKDVLAAIEQLGIRENNYEDMSRFIDVLQEKLAPIQERFHTPNIVIGSFVSPDTGASDTIYLTEFGIILETVDPINGGEVRKSDPNEIWRYLYPPSQIVENIVSMLIAVAEKHKSIKDEWILSFKGITDLSVGEETCKT